MRITYLQEHLTRKGEEISIFDVEPGEKFMIVSQLGQILTYRFVHDINPQKFKRRGDHLYHLAPSRSRDANKLFTWQKYLSLYFNQASVWAYKAARVEIEVEIC
jgi:hypothetical protein